MGNVTNCMNWTALAIAGVLAVTTISPNQGGRARQGIEPGKPAMDFKLKFLSSEKTFTLSSNFGKRPTVLIFGSYT